MVDDLEALSFEAPFPPADLMHRVSALSNNAEFAAHGRDIFRALQNASPKPLCEFTNILDFGVGSGRLARMFKGYTGHYHGADVDHELLNWTAGALPWVKPLPTFARAKLPCADQQFDCVISVSVFTHMNEEDSRFYLRELQRVSRPNATLLLTVHGRRASERAMQQANIADMLAIPRGDIAAASLSMEAGGFHFTKKSGHLTTDQYEYGISFTSEPYIRKEWSEFFDVTEVVPGAIHDFQDIVVGRA